MLCKFLQTSLVELNHQYQNTLKLSEKHSSLFSFRLVDKKFDNIVTSSAAWLVSSSNVVITKKDNKKNILNSIQNITPGNTK